MLAGELDRKARIDRLLGRTLASECRIDAIEKRLVGLNDVHLRIEALEDSIVGLMRALKEHKGQPIMRTLDQHGDRLHAVEARLDSIESTRELPLSGVRETAWAARCRTKLG